MRVAREAGRRARYAGSASSALSPSRRNPETEAGCLAGERLEQVYSRGENGAEAGSVMGSV